MVFRLLFLSIFFMFNSVFANRIILQDSLMFSINDQYYFQSELNKVANLLKYYKSKVGTSPILKYVSHRFDYIKLFKLYHHYRPFPLSSFSANNKLSTELITVRELASLDMIIAKGFSRGKEIQLAKNLTFNEFKKLVSNSSISKKEFDKVVNAASLNLLYEAF